MPGNKPWLEKNSCASGVCGMGGCPPRRGSRAAACDETSSSCSCSSCCGESEDSSSTGCSDCSNGCGGNFNGCDDSSTDSCSCSDCSSFTCEVRAPSRPTRGRSTKGSTRSTRGRAVPAQNVRSESSKGSSGHQSTSTTSRGGKAPAAKTSTRGKKTSNTVKESQKKTGAKNGKSSGGSNSRKSSCGTNGTCSGSSNRRNSQEHMSPVSAMSGLTINSDNESAQGMQSKSAANGSSSSDICCPVCWETLSEMKRNKKEIMTTRCGHIFCKPCINFILDSNSNPKCPKCRKRVARSSVHTLFLD